MRTVSPEVEAALPPPPEAVWELAPEPSESAVRVLARALKLPPALCRILVARGFDQVEPARDFLRPLLDHLHPPELLADAERGSQRILRAIRQGETILVHGDYDVDGVCSTAILTLWLRELGGEVVPFVPHRMTDGYDLGSAGLQAAAQAGASLLITCDSGIVAHQAVGEAGRMGIDVIVTDHHTPGPTLPPAVAVINPARDDCSYPDPRLAGAGVVFKLCQLLAQQAGRSLDEVLPLLDLVALATIADLVPLQGENRVLVRYGLRVLRETRRPGLLALMDVTALEKDGVDAGQVGFVLGPRLNAAGRMGAAADALKLLLSQDPGEAMELAQLLEERNTRRKEEDHRTLEEALVHLGEEYDAGTDFGVVLGGEGWHPGVIGIVASRVVERIHRPTVLLAIQDGRARGSARSIPGVDLYQAVRACAPLLTRFGGHKQAAGMELDPARIPEFRDRFSRAVRDQLKGQTPRPLKRADATLELAEANDELHHLLQYMGPFGIGNPRPVFWAQGLKVPGGARVVGTDHLKLRFRSGTGSLDAIGFGLARRMTPDVVAQGPVDALFQLRENEYRGRRTLQARLVDLRVSGRDGRMITGTQEDHGRPSGAPAPQGEPR